MGPEDIPARPQGTVATASALEPDEATIVTAGFDPLRDDGLMYGETLACDGVAVNQLHYEAMVHGFTSVPHRWDQADEALDYVATELRTAFEGEE